MLRTTLLRRTDSFGKGNRVRRTRKAAHAVGAAVLAEVGRSYGLPGRPGAPAEVEDSGLLPGLGASDISRA